MHEGGWYECDPRNHKICTCIFIVTAVIVGTWLLGLHTEKSVSVHNCQRWRTLQVMNHGERSDYITEGEVMNDLLPWCNWRRKSGMIYYRSCLCGVEVFGMGGTPGWMRHWSCCDGSILGEKSGFWNGSGVTKAPGYLDTCHHPMGQILTTIDAPSSLACRSMWKRNQESVIGERDSLVPQTRLDTRRQEKIWIINVDSSGLTWRLWRWLTAGVLIDSVPWNL